MKKIRVLLVDDSLLVITVLKRMLSSSPEIEVVGSAGSGQKALQLVSELKPDVICVDLHMPGMDGYQLTQEIMATHPCPILVVSTSVQKNNSQNIFRALEAGALDVYPKPDGGLQANKEEVEQELIQKIKILSGVYVFHKTQNKVVAPTPPELSSTVTQITSNQVPKLQKASTKSSIQMIAIGASIGGPIAIEKIVTQLPSTFPIPIVCIQHISQGFLSEFVEWLDSICALKVKIAKQDEKPLPGNIYFPREDKHLEIVNGAFSHAVINKKVDGHLPSITVTFKEVAKYYKKNAIGVILTGMGRDGASGIQAIAQAGGHTIAQDEETCVVFGMPKEAIALGGIKHVLPVQDIPNMLIKYSSM